jgi:hypothetical protein
MIALMTILAVWSIAIALTFASADLSAGWSHARASAATTDLGR